jgi:hypothetical protein
MNLRGGIQAIAGLEPRKDREVTAPYLLHQAKSNHSQDWATANQDFYFLFVTRTEIFFIFLPRIPIGSSNV